MTTSQPNWNGPQPAPKELWKIVHAAFPVTRNLGIFNNRNVAGTNTPSAHAEGRALDIGLLTSQPAEKALADQLFGILIQNAGELGVDHVIWNRQIWSTAHPIVRAYAGTNAHTDHIHIAFTRLGSQKSSFPSTLIAISILRSAYEDRAKAFANIA